MNWILTGVSAPVLMTVGAALAGAITLLYLVRVRRRRVQVPFSPLWRKVLQQRSAASLWDRLKRLLSWLLQLLLLALGNPRREGDVDESRAVVLLVDTSASMQADDEQGGRTRLQSAQDRALDVLQTLGPRDEVMVVRFDHSLRPLTPFTRDLAQAEQAVRQLDTTDSGGGIEEPVRFALEALEGRPRGELVVISDGVVETSEDATLDLPPNVRGTWLRVGQPAQNVGIRAFNVRRYPANRTNYEVLVSLRNFAPTPVRVELELVGEGQLIRSEEVELGANASEQLIYADLPAAGAHLQARIRLVGGDVVDTLAADDVAYALLPRDRMTRVLLVSAGNLYLEGALLLNESVETNRVTPTEFAQMDPSEVRSMDVIILDSVTPPLPERGNFMFFAPSGPDSPWEVSDDVVDPIIHSTRDDHPLLRYMGTLRDVNIARARLLRTTSDDVVVASAIGGYPMIVARSTIERRLLAVAFRPSDSDFPLRVGFVVLLLNAVDWFLQEDVRVVDAWTTGESWALRVDDRDATSARISGPDGLELEVPAWDGQVVYTGARAGFYTVTAGSATLELAANLTDEREASMVAADLLVPSTRPWASELPDNTKRGTWDPWLLMVLAAFVLLALEWWTWNRRWTV